MSNFINHYSLIIFIPILLIILLFIFFKITKNKISFLFLFSLSIFIIFITINYFSPKELDQKVNSPNELSDDKIKFVQVYSKTCIGCIINEPFIRELELELVDQFSLSVKLLKLDVSNQNNFELIKKLNAFTTPSYLILSNDNKILWKQSGGLINKKEVINEIINYKESTN
ncbi:MAG: hypothetical protein CL746_03335 [Chloroflexi bacterium]|nr:hypothetical protein [Chloroflexota bacterium]|tara:strand:- start:3088 stop:3600 length:513 start_codon:yes stop_codon:yes gene_type:complete